MVDGTTGPIPLEMGRDSFLIDDIRSRETLGRLRGNGAFASALKKKMDETALGKPPGVRDDKKLLDVCYEMESIFIGYMLKSMRKTIDESDFFGKSIAKDIFSDMLYDEYSKMMARTEQLGIAGQIYDQLRGQKTL